MSVSAIVSETFKDRTRISINYGKDYIDWRIGMGRTAEICDIVVNSERRKGHGKKLINEMMKQVLELPEKGRPALIYALTRHSNSIAHQFYEALGFHIVGRLHYFYRESGDRHEHGVVYGLEC